MCNPLDFPRKVVSSKSWPSVGFAKTHHPSEFPLLLVCPIHFGFSALQESSPYPVLLAIRCESACSTSWWISQFFHMMTFLLHYPLARWFPASTFPNRLSKGFAGQWSPSSRTRLLMSSSLLWTGCVSKGSCPLALGLSMRAWQGYISRRCQMQLEFLAQGALREFSIELDHIQMIMEALHWFGWPSKSLNASLWVAEKFDCPIFAILVYDCFPNDFQGKSKCRWYFFHQSRIYGMIMWCILVPKVSICNFQIQLPPLLLVVFLFHLLALTAPFPQPPNFIARTNYQFDASILGGILPKQFDTATMIHSRVFACLLILLAFLLSFSSLDNIGK